jgi:ATP-dependent Clp endopeptidase proteolytic subunit ClpP
VKTFKSILDDDRARLLLYGEISDAGGEGMVSSAQVVSDLLWLDDNYAHTDVHINSVGGEVYPGIAIFNTLRRMKSDVTIYVDGIAASIAGVIALCGKPVKMSQYSRLMLHSVSGGCYGNKNDLADMIREIETLEETIAEIISRRCGMDKETVKTTYFDGKDHWLSAQEALSLGLADEIYDVDETVPDESTADDIYRIFTNRMESIMDEHPQTTGEMKLEDLKKINRFANCADEEAALAAVSDTAQRADELEAENETQRQRIEELETERVTEAVESAVRDGRIGADQRETYTNLLRADYANGKAVLNGLKPKRMLKDELEGGKAEQTTGAWARRQQEIRNKYYGRKE